MERVSDGHGDRSQGQQGQTRRIAMTRTMRLSLAVSTALLAAGIAAGVSAQQQTPMTFFVTSVGKGNGADLGGLDGADSHCGTLAKAAGSTLTNWRAYLSTTLPGGDAGVSARDR